MVEEESPKGRRGKRNNSLEADETILLDTTSVLGRTNALKEYIRSIRMQRHPTSSAPLVVPRAHG
jgi:hypothetical protein